MEEGPFTVLDNYIIVTTKTLNAKNGKGEKPYRYDKAIIFIYFLFFIF